MLTSGGQGPDESGPYLLKNTFQASNLCLVEVTLPFLVFEVEMLLEQALHQMQTGQKAGEVLQMLHHTGFLGEGLLNQCTPCS